MRRLVKLLRPLLITLSLRHYEHRDMRQLLCGSVIHGDRDLCWFARSFYNESIHTVSQSGVIESGVIQHRLPDSSISVQCGLHDTKVTYNNNYAGCSIT